MKLPWSEKAVTDTVRDERAEPVLPDRQPRTARLSQREAKRHLEAYGGIDAIDWVMDCVELISQTASNAPFHFEDDEGELVLHKLPEHSDDVREAPGDLVNLFAAPNPQMTYADLIELTVIDFLITGNAYWVKFPAGMDKPLSLWRLQPDQVQVIPGEEKLVKEYVFHPQTRGGEEVHLPAKQVIHFKRPNPHSPYHGIGVIAGAPRMYDIELFLTDHVASYYENATRPSGIIKSSRFIAKKALDKIRAMFRAAYQGPRNAGNVIALERDFEFQPISANATEAQLTQMAELTKKRILAAFRVPEVLLGQVQSADRQAVREAQRIFATNTMRPFLNRFQQQVTNALTREWGVDFVIDFEYSMPVEDRYELAGNFATLPGVKVKEVREFVGLPPTGKKEIDELVLNLPGENDNESKVKDRNLDSEAGRPPKGENTEAIPEDGDLPEDAAARRGDD